MSNHRVRQIQYVGLLILTVVILEACGRNGASGGQTMHLSVGDVREVTLPEPGGTAELTGTSDNSEIADVTPKPATSETGTNLVRPTTFLVKGVTVGTVRVVFSEKQPGETGTGKLIKAYQVRVETK